MTFAIGCSAHCIQGLTYLDFSGPAVLIMEMGLAPDSAPTCVSVQAVVNVQELAGGVVGSHSTVGRAQGQVFLFHIVPCGDVGDGVESQEHSSVARPLVKMLKHSCTWYQ